MCGDTIHDDERRVGEPQLLGKVLRRLILDLRFPAARQGQRGLEICDSLSAPPRAFDRAEIVAADFFNAYRCARDNHEEQRGEKYQRQERPT